MPKGNDWFNFMYVTIAYIIMAGGMVLFIALDDIRANWPKYRCNPVYMPLSEDVEKDFTFCIQNMQMNYMGVLLKPILWIIKSLGSTATDVLGSLQNFRKMIYWIRHTMSGMFEAMMGFFANLVIQMQKMSISIKDLMGKLIGTMVTILYMLDGTVKTMQSAWSGPPGGMVRAMCFRNDTLVKLSNNKVVKMQDVCLGDILDNGKKVHAVMKIMNANNESFYKFKCKSGEPDIYVTGSHYVLDETIDKYVMAKNHPDSVLTEDVDETFSCLITEDHKINIGGITFWDWEDDIIPNKV